MAGDAFSEFGGAEEPVEGAAEQADAPDPFGAFGGAEEQPFVPVEQRPTAAAPFPPHPDGMAAPRAESEKSWLDRAATNTAGFVQGAAQGMMLGARTPLDYATAAGQYAYGNLTGTDTDWETALAEAKSAGRTLEKEAPIANIAGQVAGTVATAIPTGGLGTIKLGTQAAAKTGQLLAPLAGAAGVMTPRAASAVRLAQAVSALGTAGAAGAAQQAVVRQIDQAVESGDYSGLAERMLPAVLEESAKGAGLSLGLGAAGAGVSAGIKKLIQAGAGDWVSGRAFKSILGITNRKGVKLADKRVPGGAEALGRSMLDEGVVTPGASFDDISERLKRKRDEVGRALGEARKEVDDLAGQPRFVEEVYTPPAPKPPRVAYKVSKRDLSNVDDLNESELERLAEDPDATGRAIFDIIDVPPSELGGVARDAGRSASIAKGIKEGKELPPVRAVWDGVKWAVEDGNHRSTTAADLGYDRVPVLVERWWPKGGEPPPLPNYTPAAPQAIKRTVELPPLVEAPDGRALWSHIEEKVLGPLRSDPVKRGMGRTLEGKLADLRADLLGEVDSIGNALPEGSVVTPRKLSWDDVTRIRMSMDDVLRENWKSLSENVGTESYKNVRRAVNEFWMESAEAAAEKAGNPDLVKRIKDLTSRYAKLSLADDLAQEGVAARLANRFVSVSDYGAGGAAGLAGLITGGPASGVLMSAAGAAANKVARERGNQVIAGSLYGLSKRLMGVQKRVQEATQLQKLLQPITVASRLRGEMRHAEPIEKLSPSVVRGLADAEETLDPESDRSREHTALLQEIEMELGPDVAKAVKAQVEARAKFLLEKAPPVPPPSVFDGSPKRELGDDDVRTMKRYMDAVDDPESALERVRDGKETAEDMDTLGTLYPSMLRDFRSLAAEQLAGAKEPPPYDERLALSARLGIPLTADTDPTAMSYWQGVSSRAAAEPVAPPPRKRVNGYDNNADKVASPADRVT